MAKTFRQYFEKRSSVNQEFPKWGRGPPGGLDGLLGGPQQNEQQCNFIYLSVCERHLNSYTA